MNIKLTSRHITYGLYLSLFCLVVGIWIWEFKKFDEFLGAVFSWEERYDLPNLTYGLKLSNLFTASILSLVLGIGLFLRNKVGWILVTSWFYFVFSNFIKSLIEDKIDGFTDILGLLLLLAIPVSLIYLMNKFKGIKNYHQIEGKSKLNLNLWAIGIGILLALVRIYKKNLLQHWL